MSKKIEVKLDRKIYVTANYNQYSDEFDISMQTWEPGGASDSFIIDTVPFTYDSHTSREALVKKQLGKLDTKETELRKEFNEDMLRVGDVRQKLLALTYDEQYADTDDVNNDQSF